MDVGGRGGRQHVLDGRGGGQGGRKQLPRSRHLGVATSELQSQDLCRLRVELHSALQQQYSTRLVCGQPRTSTALNMTLPACC